LIFDFINSFGVRVGVLSVAAPPTAHAGLHPEPKMAIPLFTGFPATRIIPVLTSWLCNKLLFSLALNVQEPVAGAAADFGATGSARAVAKLARTRSVICMMWIDVELDD
jgi:hypothetical protein